MHSPAGGSIEFETPENVRIRYPLAGPGTRFLAWLLDWLISIVLTIVIAIVLVVLAGVSGTLESQLRDLQPDQLEAQGPQFAQYFLGIMLIVFTFGSFWYFFLSEWLMRGQTIGKRVLGLRVVKADGFSLDSTGLLLRNIFRFVDHAPPLWVIPVLSAQHAAPGGHGRRNVSRPGADGAAVGVSRAARGGARRWSADSASPPPSWHGCDRSTCTLSKSWWTAGTTCRRGSCGGF